MADARFADLHSKTVLITGASGGQGAAEVSLFASLGANVVGVDLVEPAEQQDNDVNVVSIVGDVRDPAVWDQAVKTALDRFGRIDALVNNAGIHRNETMLESSLQSIAQIMDNNFMSAVLGMQAVVPHMRGRGGAIVNVASIVAQRGYSTGFAYGCSKWALRGASRAAAVELGPLGIRVNCIFPGAVDTPMVTPAMRETHAKLAGASGSRMARPEEVARAVVFLACDDSIDCNGAELNVDGGAMA